MGNLYGTGSRRPEGDATQRGLAMIKSRLMLVVGVPDSAASGGATLIDVGVSDSAASGGATLIHVGVSDSSAGFVTIKSTSIPPINHWIYIRYHKFIASWGNDTEALGSNGQSITH